jgi:hypothetical protein
MGHDDTLCSSIGTVLRYIVIGINYGRVISAMGCTHGCAESQRCSQSDTVRSHAQNLLLRLSQKFRIQFAKFYQSYVVTQNMSTVMDFFHALCGFCSDSSALLSPMSEWISTNY